jgi:hypothetical protein
MANEDTIRTWSKSALILSGALLFIVKSEYYWKQIVGLVPLVVKVIIAMLAVAIIVMMIISSVRIYKESGKLKIKMFLPLVIYLIAISLSFIDPFKLNVESLQSKVILKGHFSAVMNTAEITFRNNGRVEFEGNGFLGYTFFYSGTWTRDGDTLMTIFKKDDPIPWGNRLIIYPDDKLLLPTDSVAVNQHFPGFLIDDEHAAIAAKSIEEKSV